MNHFNNALIRIRPSKSSLLKPTNTLLNLGYPFKEEFLLYSTPLTEIKNSFYLRFCFLLDFFSIEIIDIINLIVKLDANEDSTDHMNSINYFYNKRNSSPETFINYVDQFITLLNKKNYTDSHFDKLLNHARTLVINSYENVEFNQDIYSYFSRFFNNDIII